MNVALDSTWFYQFTNALASLATFWGIAAIMLGMILLVLCVSSRVIRMWAMAIMLWTASLGYYSAGRNLIFPLENIRTYGRGITTALLGILVLPSIIAVKGWRRRALAGTAIAYFAFEMVFSFREVLFSEQGGTGGMGRFILGALLYGLTFIVLGWGLPRWIQSMEDFHRVITFIGVAATIFCGATFAQTIINRAPILDANNRMIGTTGNPQHCAVELALMITPLCYLVAGVHQSIWKRVFFGGVASTAGIFLLWTGSRTGVLMTLVGLVWMFRYRMGRALLLASIAAVFVMALLSVFSSADVVSEHLTSGTDTRSQVWSAQFQEFLQHPIVGQDFGSFGYSENSYLATMARYGIIGLIPLLVVFGMAVRSARRLSRAKKNLGPYKLAADMVTANLLSLAAGAWFEAYLLGTITIMIYMVYIDFALINALIDISETTVPRPEGFDVILPDDHFAGAGYPQYAEVF